MPDYKDIGQTGNSAFDKWWVENGSSVLSLKYSLMEQRLKEIGYLSAGLQPALT